MHKPDPIVQFLNGTTTLIPTFKTSVFKCFRFSKGLPYYYSSQIVLQIGRSFSTPLGERWRRRRCQRCCVDEHGRRSLQSITKDVHATTTGNFNNFRLDSLGLQMLSQPAKNGATIRGTHFSMLSKSVIFSFGTGFLQLLVFRKTMQTLKNETPK